MSGESIEDRLRDHEKAFQGLLSLIPAKLYYGEDVEDQWKRKKQTKEEARAAKFAKLDPANAKSAKDVMDENFRKRKRDGTEEPSDMGDVEPEAPKEGLKPAGKKVKNARKQDISQAPTSSEDSKTTKSNGAPSGTKTGVAEKRRAKRDRKRALKAEQLERTKQNKERKKQLKKASNETAPIPEKQKEDESAHEDDGHAEFDPSDAVNLDEKLDVQDVSASTASVSSPDHSPAFTTSNPQSGTSSISSVMEPLSGKSEPKPQSPNRLPAQGQKVPSAEAKARLQKRIDELRAARKADNDDGSPARTRQELIESRRRKEEQRKAHKKQLRQQAKEEERRQKEEALAHGSPLLSPAIMSPRGSHGQSPPSNGFAFGRISFDDGQIMNAGLDRVINPQKKKGPQDVNTALEAAKNREARINGLDAEKRADIEDKEMWLNARKRAQGERVRDDTSLLKKTLQRKEKQKKKSEKEWNDRIEGVAKGQAFRQQKREENLRKRKEEKGSKSKKGNKGTKSKAKARPGFEGSFRAGGKNK